MARAGRLEQVRFAIGQGVKQRQACTLMSVVAGVCVQDVGARRTVYWSHTRFVKYEHVNAYTVNGRNLNQSTFQQFNDPFLLVICNPYPQRQAD